MLNRLFWIVVALFIERILDRKPAGWAVGKSRVATTYSDGRTYPQGGFRDANIFVSAREF